MHVVERDSLERLFSALKKSGYEIIGPTVQNGAVVYDRIEGCGDLPAGWGDEQEAGTYRLKKRGDGALFGYVVGPTSWKKFLFPPKLELWQAKRAAGGIQFKKPANPSVKTAFIGVRSCEIHAIGIQDKVFLGGPHADPHYKARREDVLIIAVNCTEPGGTCFCVSMNTGPKALGGFDLSLTEVMDTGRHYFLVETGTPKGEAILEGVPRRPAQGTETAAGETLIGKAKSKMGRTMDTRNIKEILYQNAQHPQWDDAAGRCLSCANCTMACPTCFCSTVNDVTDLTGRHTQRRRLWDSCFNLDFSYIHGGHVRGSTKGRYRQWMTHKLASWHDQFGSSGCVGCGRCITWCPVGIDITREVKKIRENPVTQKTIPSGKEAGHENH